MKFHPAVSVYSNNCSSVVHISGDANDVDSSFDFVNSTLASLRLCWIATIGINVSTEPVLDKSAPVLLGKFAAMEGELKNVQLIIIL